MLTQPPQVQNISRRKSETGTEEAVLAGNACISPATIGSEHRGRVSRRFSYTLTRNHTTKDGVPYARLVDGPILLPAKLDSDSKLHTDRCKSILDVPDTEQGPKNSVSDSKLAVDYFNSKSNDVVSDGAIKMENGSKLVNVSESHHSLSARFDTEERLRQEVMIIIFLKKNLTSLKHNLKKF